MASGRNPFTPSFGVSPALELIDDLPDVGVEVCTWQGLSRLRFSGNGGLWCTYMQGSDYLTSKDPTQY